MPTSSGRLTVYEPGFNWKNFKELIENHFCPVSLQ